MFQETESYRWWENYLVRYLMPSIAGVAIVSWLSKLAPRDFREALFLGSQVAQFDPATLTLLILYGNLFCYVASYPILGFHVTRVLDFNGSTWEPSKLDGYIWTIIIGVFAMGIAEVRFLLPGHAPIFLMLTFGIVVCFSVIQLLRIKESFQYRKIKGLKEESSQLYGFIYSLSYRRGVVEQTKMDTARTQQEGEKEQVDRTEKTSEIYRRKREIMDTYRHMREHGNSAFIFVLQITLAALCYCIVTSNFGTGTQMLSCIGVLLVIWALPSVFIHCVGQAVERRFSHYDRRI